MAIIRIAWWVRPALGALKAFAQIAPRRCKERVEQGIDYCIDRIVDYGIRPVIHEVR